MKVTETHVHTHLDGYKLRLSGVFVAFFSS